MEHGFLYFMANTFPYWMGAAMVALCLWQRRRDKRLRRLYGAGR